MAIEYKKRFSDEYPDEPIECDCCEYPGRVALFEQTMTHDGFKDLWLCEVCSKTLLSIAKKYPAQTGDPKLYKSIAVIANMILDEIRNHAHSH